MALAARRVRVDDEVPPQLPRAGPAELDSDGFAGREPREQAEAIGALADEALAAGQRIRGFAFER